MEYFATREAIPENHKMNDKKMESSASDSPNVASMNDAPKNIGVGAKRPGRPRRSVRDHVSTDSEVSSFQECSSADGLSKRPTRSARGSLPIDDDDAHYYPCPFPSCDYNSESRSARNYHLRVDHAGCAYQSVAQETEPSSSSAEKTTGAYGAKPARPRTTVKIENEYDGTGEMSADVPRDPRSQLESIRGYNIPSSDAYSETDADCDVDLDDEDYEIAHYKRDESYSEMKYDSDFHPTHVRRKRGRPKNPPGTEPAENSKVRVSDPNGKYRCYMPDCDWKGAYRSLRCDHMKWCHKDWVMPPRYILQRITKDGIYIDPKTFVPPFSCPIEGCQWRGSYRASRSQHIKSAHPDYVPPKKKAPIGGYVPNGKYVCHVPQCPWRGISRSTRASHMRKVHGGFSNPGYSTRQVACCDCSESFGSHKAFVDHMITAHREWFNSVQDVFSVTYVKRMGIKQGHEYQVLYLYCARSGGSRPKHIPGRDYFPEFTKRRLTRRPTKCGRNCAAFLRIIHWIDGRLTVIGCVEHTGHRMGTALLRLSSNERVVLDEYLYVVDDKVPLDAMLDRIREVEGFTMDGFDVTERSIEDMTRYVMNENEFISLKVLFETSTFFEPESTFAVNLFSSEGTPLSEGISFGIMTSQMRELWATCSARAACIEEVNLLISDFELHLFFVMVFDADDMPRCACVLISQSGDKVALLDKLRSVSNAAVDTVVTDCSPDWPALLDAYFGNEAYTTDFQIAEWHLLSEWATRIDEMVSNRVDRFAILCALRRWTRATDPTLFEEIVIDIFEAFREMELNSLAQLVDTQLTDPDFAKRWTPLNRNPLTDHSNPVLEISCRMFRERFLNCELCARLDEYAGLLNDRITEFNSLTFSDVYTLAPIEPPRHVPQMYEDIDPSQLLADGTVMSSPQRTVEIESHPSEPPKRMDSLMELSNKRMKLEGEEELGAYVVVGEEEVLDEVVEGAEAEQLVEEAVLSGALGGIDDGVSLLDPNSDGGAPDVELAENRRKARLKRMMQILHEKVDMMADDETMELMETGLTQVVEQLKDPALVMQPRRSARLPKQPQDSS
ncbi:C2H2-type domain-containing protein [Trichostrongylus colubriformis]|uniref:C2H2-type domain-containing protein n=1 Tax=Trichostrongylus colubriformis TaxID=6319 RepID=A0AAN8FQ11_TRICO